MCMTQASRGSHNTDTGLLTQASSDTRLVLTHTSRLVDYWHIYSVLALNHVQVTWYKVFLCR